MINKQTNELENYGTGTVEITLGINRWTNKRAKPQENDAEIEDTKWMK